MRIAKSDVRFVLHSALPRSFEAFFLVISRPRPRATLFPYTTLFRSVWTVCPPPLSSTSMCRGRIPRSEEHTSELQSRGHLVCRLLLEKKKNGGQKRPGNRDRQAPRAVSGAQGAGPVAGGPRTGDGPG